MLTAFRQFFLLTSYYALTLTLTACGVGMHFWLNCILDLPKNYLINNLILIQIMFLKLLSFHLI